jgi:hypothetical protein
MTENGSEEGLLVRAEPLGLAEEIPEDGRCGARRGRRAPS